MYVYNGHWIGGLSLVKMKNLIQAEGSRVLQRSYFQRSEGSTGSWFYINYIDSHINSSLIEEYFQGCRILMNKHCLLIVY